MKEEKNEDAALETVPPSRNSNAGLRRGSSYTRTFISFRNFSRNIIANLRTIVSGVRKNK